MAFMGRKEHIKARIMDMAGLFALSIKTDIPVDKVYGLFCGEAGYQTPKIDTRAAVFVDDKILLVHENNGTWSLPGGWCDVDQSVASNAEKEVREEAGFTVTSEKSSPFRIGESTMSQIMPMA